MVHGEWPAPDVTIDHKNGDRGDNAGNLDNAGNIHNLRAATYAEKTGIGPRTAITSLGLRASVSTPVLASGARSSEPTRLCIGWAGSTHLKRPRRFTTRLHVGCTANLLASSSSRCGGQHDTPHCRARAGDHHTAARQPSDFIAREIDDGIVLAGSDPHWTVSQPGNATITDKSIATGHTHQPNVVRLSNAATGSFWGVDLGTMAALHSSSFAYTECAAATGIAGWASSFAVFTFVGGPTSTATLAFIDLTARFRLLWREMVHVVSEEHGLVSFRGELIHVGRTIH